MMSLNNPRPDAPSLCARRALDAQATDKGRHFGISLDALWREAGSPEGESPVDWLELARPVVDAFTCYRRRLHQATAHEQPGEYAPLPATWHLDRRTLAVVVVTLGDPRSFEVGDVMALEEIADLYATFLDHRGLRRNLTRTGGRGLTEHHARTAGHPRFTGADPRPTSLVALASA